MKKQQLQETKQYLQEKGITHPQIGIVLGTGLGKLVDYITIDVEIRYADIPNFPEATVESHSGKLIYGTLSGKKVLVMSGRFHLYEGYNLWEVTYGIRTMHQLGITTLLVSNAAGAINLNFKKGDVMLIEDHINLQGNSPLAFKGAGTFGDLFADMLAPYSKKINQKLKVIAKANDINLQEGVYASVVGPQLETRAEYRMLQILEVDAVGMSTVPEVIVAKHLQLPCAAISVLTDECDPKNLQPVNIEEIIANANHVKLALEHDIDLLWIGARSTVSPFIVQEIAEALNGTDKIVLVKNPVNPDLALWLGGIERLYTANIKNLGVIHRGFSTYEKTKYRNIPEWQIAIELQNRFPDLPLICDPSHITGNRDMIFDVSQTALDLNFDGLMIETHFDPENAWSDAAQQVTPKTLIQIMEDLRIRKPTDTEADYRAELENLRTQINIADSQLIDVLGKRMKVSDRIGELKKQKNVAVLQSRRWNEILGNMILEGESRGLSEEFVLRMFKAIHQESINHQEKIIKG